MHQLLTGILKKLTILAFIIPVNVSGQQHRISLPEYIERYNNIAIAEMRASGIPASIKLAQAILESGFGNSELAVMANNHFGIKCNGWPGRTYFYDDDEPQECFRKYSDPLYSFLDHTEFLTTRPWYDFLFELEVTDFEGWAHGLKDAGYATNPRYAESLIRLINDHRLHRFDQKALDPSYILTDQFQLAVSEQRESIDTSSDRLLRPAEEGVRQVLTYNRINYIIARPGDTPATIAGEVDIREGRIKKYNNIDESEDLEPGQRVYIQPKRRRGEERYHIAEAGETMTDISHEYGIRIENLYRRNDMQYGMEPEPGQRILLRGYEGNFIQYLLRRP